MEGDPNNDIEIKIIDQPVYLWYLQIGAPEMGLQFHFTSKPPNFLKRWFYQFLLGWEVIEEA